MKPSGNQEAAATSPCSLQHGRIQRPCNTVLQFYSIIQSTAVYPTSAFPNKLTSTIRFALPINPSAVLDQPHSSGNFKDYTPNFTRGKRAVTYPDSSTHIFTSLCMKKIGRMPIYHVKQLQ